MKNMKIRKIHDILLTTMMLIIILGGGYLYFIYLIDGVYYKIPLTKYNTEMKTEKTIYKSNESINATWSYCLENRNIEKISKTWTFINHIVYNLPSAASFVNNPSGCNTIKVFIITVPADLPDGIYYLQGTISYKVNSVKTVTYLRRTNTFQVVHLDKK
jgi:hypothetical protein